MTRNLYTIRGTIEEIVAADTADEALEKFYNEHEDVDDAEVKHEEPNEPEYEH